MILVRKFYRALSRWLENIRSALRIVHFRIKYPSLRIDFSSHLSRGVEIISADSASCVIERTWFARDVLIKADQNASFQIRNSYVGKGSMIVAHEYIEIGQHCSIGEMVVIRDQDHRYDQGLLQHAGFVTAKVIIHNNVWLGSKCTILKGVELGENTVVGAHALVNKSFPDNSVIVGTPAQQIKIRPT